MTSARSEASSLSYTFLKSRGGEIIPGCPQPLHSMIDPEREARRLVLTEGEGSGFLVFLGLGGGFAPEAALELTNAQVAVIDFDANSVKELFANRDYSGLLTNSRFTLLVDPGSEEIKNFFLEHYKPALHGGIKTIPLRGRVEQDRVSFENAASAIKEAIEIISFDYSVQAHFGKRWFSNIIRNVRQPAGGGKREENDAAALYGRNLFYTPAAKLPALKNKIRNIALAAAGPSLDMQIESLSDLKSRGGYIICTDTALGALFSNGIEPDAVVSIDCQHISCSHFIGFSRYLYQRNIPLVLDIASPPMLAALSPHPVFFASGHPLARYISAYLRPLPQLDTSGANVTHACLSLAESIIAGRFAWPHTENPAADAVITLFGADFSYIKSQAYARGAYIYPYFSKRQNRLSPLEAQLSSLLYRSPFLPSPDGEKKDYYETSSLRFYRKKLEEKASLINAKIIREKGLGAPINLEKKVLNNDPLKDPAAGGLAASSLAASLNELSGEKFLEHYRNDIAALPAADGKDNYFKKLNEKEAQVFTTLLPLAAAVKKRNAADIEQKDLIEEVKKFSIKEIEKALRAD